MTQPSNSSSRTYVAVLQSGNFTVGRMNELSGLFTTDGSDWSHFGWKNVRCFSVAVDPKNAEHILLGCGNGVHESHDGGANWRVLTGWRITEVLDVTFDPHNPDRFVCATAFGLWKTEDGGNSWLSWSDGLSSLFAPTLSVSRSEGTIWTGTEKGVFRISLSETEQSWQMDGLTGFAVRQIVTTEQGLQVAATHGQGAWIREVGGPWIRIRGVPADAICYAIAVDNSGRRIAVGGCFKGVYVSLDRGRTAIHNVVGAPDSWTHALAYDSSGNWPDRPLLVGTTSAGLHTLTGVTWNSVGLSGTTIGRIISEAQSA